ncbi:transcription elongation factor B polypeptide 3-like isoform X2 [Varroa jacobsoni]|uniref:TFIIS N-terminal domain-containing protein n=1 Tax=Varroa destructor TaxID=109461 RepID=A0A7M7MCP7_VARDE|nr:transcription elongation factor B polypeptide 3-like isoform X2 [Varroa destructor]XP_022707547.1 transcription elongation factor B polypeptide 3-like isoform X2 [Varroa jacobsoni]
MSILEKIKQYCRRLEKHSDDKLVIKETLNKLNKMEVTVDILQETGIGKIVSCIKKRNDSAGVMATDLIRKWRKVVDREAEMENPPAVDEPEPYEPMPVDDVKFRKLAYEGVRNQQDQRLEKIKEEKRGSHAIQSDRRELESKSSSSSNKLPSSKHNKFSSGKAPEPELFSDAAVVIKKELKDESSHRHPKDSSSKHSGSRKEDRKHHHSHHSNHNEKEERRSSHKSEQRNHHKDKSKSDYSRSAETSSKYAKEIKREKDVSLETAPKIKSEKRPETHRAEGDNSSVQIKQESSSSKEKERRDRKRKAPEGTNDLEEEPDGMNAANFGSFEDCLGSIDPKKHRKKKKLSGAKLSAAVSPKMTVTSSTLNGSINKPKGPRLPDLLDVKKATEAQNLLPMSQLVTDYKPLPRMEPKSSACTSSSGAKVNASNRVMTNEEAVLFTTSRKDRTAVYSGRKQHTLTSVPTLYEACVRVLTEHVDLIDETGGVPFDIMRPIMERCSWQQLERLEYYNPYLTEDSDPLWEIHVKRDFRGKTPAKGEETWRELHMRCRDEREQKLQVLKESISKSMKEKQDPVRKTKLAYVDTMAKPPRNVQRAQLKHGTHLANKSQPSQSRSIAATASTSSAVEPVRAPTVAAKKPNKPAPLMAKTLSFLKMRKTTGYGFASR